MGGACSTCGERTGLHRVLVEKREGKKPHGGLRFRWEDNINIDFQEMGCRGIDWIELAQDNDRWLALVIAVMRFRVP